MAEFRPIVLDFGVHRLLQDSMTLYTPRLHLGPGAAGVGGAPFTIDVGTLLSSPASGAIESDGVHLYWTDAIGARHSLDTGGGGGSETLAQAYSLGGGAADQTLTLEDAKGGGFIVDGTDVGFTGTYALTVKGNQQVTLSLAIGVASPTARLHLAAGTAVAGTAPLKIPSGVVLAAPAPGAVEADANHLYWTNSSGTRLQLDDAPPSAQTMAATYGAGTIAADQTLALLMLRCNSGTWW